MCVCVSVLCVCAREAKATPMPMVQISTLVPRRDPFCLAPCPSQCAPSRFVQGGSEGRGQVGGGSVTSFSKAGRSLFLPCVAPCPTFSDPNPPGYCCVKHGRKYSSQHLPPRLFAVLSIMERTTQLYTRINNKRTEQSIYYLCHYMTVPEQ